MFSLKYLLYQLMVIVDKIPVFNTFYNILKIKNNKMKMIKKEWLYGHLKIYIHKYISMYFIIYCSRIILKNIKNLLFILLLNIN